MHLVFLHVVLIAVEFYLLTMLHLLHNRHTTFHKVVEVLAGLFRAPRLPRVPSAILALKVHLPTFVAEGGITEVKALFAFHEEVFILFSNFSSDFYFFLSPFCPATQHNRTVTAVDDAFGRADWRVEEPGASLDTSVDVGAYEGSTARAGVPNPGATEVPPCLRDNAAVVTSEGNLGRVAPDLFAFRGLACPLAVGVAGARAVSYQAKTFGAGKFSPRAELGTREYQTAVGDAL